MKTPLAVFLAATLSGCATATVPDDPARMAALQQTYNQLHARLQKATDGDPIMASAFAQPGQVLMGLRSGLIEQLAADVALHYLDTVSVDLKDVKGKSSGELGKDTFLGHITLGEWKVNVRLGKLTGHLRVGEPRLSLRRPNLIDVKLPVQVEETEGDARLFFSWDSAGLANAVCKDFELDREIRGRIVPQRHIVSGAFRLEHSGEDLVAAPIFPERHVRLKLDLTARSWEIVEAALRSQNHSGKCGTLLKPTQAVGLLRELAERGITVRLPDSIFRTVRLPAHFHQSVRVDNRELRLGIKAEGIRVEGTALWSSASVEVLPPKKP